LQRRVQRQDTGAAGRIENSQVAVFLTYAGRGGPLIDRELYLPKSWTGDRARCWAAGIPDGTVFATKPALARRMTARDAEAPAAWAAGDEVYGADPGHRRVGYVLAVARTCQVNRCRAWIRQAHRQRHVPLPPLSGNGSRCGRIEHTHCM
jgi:SRSO17 transposase